MKEWLKQIFQSHSGVSSKRVCGVLGWLICLGTQVFCLIQNQEAPQMIETLMWCCVGLLGVDSISSAINKTNNTTTINNTTNHTTTNKRSKNYIEGVG